MQQWINEALKCGFSYAAELDVDSVKLLPEVRKMCEMNTCGAYGKNWSCPPACGTLEECGERLKKYKRGLLVQTVGEIEDWMDFEGMMRIEQEHREIFDRFAGVLRRIFPDCLPVGTGGCRQCASCSYPDKPCRFPEKCYTSMEAYGMEVSRICTENHLKYNYGPGKVAYTACYFLP